MPVINTDSSLYKKIKTGAMVGGAALGGPLGLGAVFGADKLLKANPIGKDRINPVKQSRELLAADVDMMRNSPDKLGLSDADREKMRAEAVQTTSAQNQAQASQLAQAALAGQGFQQGTFEQAQGQLGQSAADAGVKAGAQINDLSNRIAEQKKADIMARLDAERERVKENTRFWTGMGIAGVGAILQAAGVPGSPLAGLGAQMMGGSSGGAAPADGGTTINLGDMGSSADLSAADPDAAFAEKYGYDRPAGA